MKPNIDLHPGNLYVRFILNNHVVLGGMLSLDIETDKHPLTDERMGDFAKKPLKEDIDSEFYQSAKALGFTPSGKPETVKVGKKTVKFDEFMAKAKDLGLSAPKDFEDRSALDPDKLEIGTIQFMDSAGNFGYLEGNETECLKKFWDIFRDSEALPTIVTFNGEGFDLPVLEARSMFNWRNGVQMPLAFTATSKWGDRDGIKHIDMAKIFQCGGKSFMKLHMAAQNCGLPGKPGDYGKDAVRMLNSGDPEKQKLAIEYMTYDVATPLQMGFLAGHQKTIFQEKMIMGVGEKSYGNKTFATNRPFILPEEYITGTMQLSKPLDENVHEFLKIVQMMNENKTKYEAGDGVNTVECSEKVKKALTGLKNNGKEFGKLFTREFNNFSDTMLKLHENAIENHNNENLSLPSNSKNPENIKSLT